jgi:hypothetical protein
MRAAQAELAERQQVSACGVATRAAHDRTCGCAGDPTCAGLSLYSPTRSEMVSARRALHTLRRLGLAELCMIRYPYSPPVLTAVSVARYGQLAGEATLKPPPCFHCGRPLGDGGGGSGWSDGISVCTECLRGKTNALALVESGGAA